jgi:hypothetical protein
MHCGDARIAAVVTEFTMRNTSCRIYVRQGSVSSIGNLSPLILHTGKAHSTPSTGHLWRSWSQGTARNDRLTG